MRDLLRVATLIAYYPISFVSLLTENSSSHHFESLSLSRFRMVRQLSNQYQLYPRVRHFQISELTFFQDLFLQLPALQY